MKLSQLEASAVTIAIEAATAALLAPHFGANSRRAALAAALGSALTHPVFWYAAYWLYPMLKGFGVPLLETLVITLESVGYRLLATSRWRTALALSVLANAASWLTGYFLYALP
jgi:uncharacterized membrane protein